MRFLQRPVTVHMDHVSAVLDVDYSPTGKEFVSASFDKTIRIFPKDGGHSRWVATIHKNRNTFRQVAEVVIECHNQAVQKMQRRLDLVNSANS